MKKIVILICLIILSLKFLNAQSDSLKVLFIGNSITYVNDMPFMFGDIANNKGQKVKVSMYAPGGTGFCDHYRDPNIYALFRNFQWDIVVLQPGSGESAGATYPVDTTAKRGNIILDSLYLNSPCAKVFLYEIPYGVPSPTTYNTYFTVQRRIRDSVGKMSDLMHLQMLPAGECVRAYYSMHQNLLMHNSYNDIHPSAYGSYMVASSFYAGIYQDTVKGCTFYAGLDPDTARKFYNIVDTVVLNRFPEWNINTYNLHAGFNYQITGNNVSFTNNSTNYSSLLWNFGDGNTSNVNHPNHCYSGPGVYLVKIYAGNNDCMDSSFKQIRIYSSDIESLERNFVEFNAFPNPSCGDINFEFVQDGASLCSMEIFNQFGILISNLIDKQVFAGKQQITWNTSNIMSGIYYAKFTVNKQVKTIKLVLIK